MIDDYWIIHTPKGDHQVCMEAGKKPGEAENRGGHPMTKVDRHGHWYEKLNDKGEWEPATSKEEIARVESEAALLMLSNLELIEHIDKVLIQPLRDEIAALKKTKVVK